MKERRVQFTATAREHVRREKSWWGENTSYANTFAFELEDGLRMISLLPGIGTIYVQGALAGLRRIYLDKSVVHIYYTHDDSNVIVRAVWPARKRRGPSFRM